MGARNFLFDGQLRGDALPDLFRRPAARGKTFMLRGGGTGDADDFFEMTFRSSLEQKRNDDNGERTIFFAPSFDLRLPAFANAWVENGFEFFARAVVGKNNLRKFVTF